jgi:hypothetical protein
VPVKPLPEVWPHGLRHAGSLDIFHRRHRLFCTSMVSGLAAAVIWRMASLLAAL